MGTFCGCCQRPRLESLGVGWGAWTASCWLQLQHRPIGGGLGLLSSAWGVLSFGLWVAVMTQKLLNSYFTNQQFIYYRPYSIMYSFSRLDTELQPEVPLMTGGFPDSPFHRLGSLKPGL